MGPTRCRSAAHPMHATSANNICPWQCMTWICCDGIVRVGLLCVITVFHAKDGDCNNCLSLYPTMHTVQLGHLHIATMPASLRKAHFENREGTKKQVSNRPKSGLIRVGLLGVITEDHVKDGEALCFITSEPHKGHRFRIYETNCLVSAVHCSTPIFPSINGTTCHCIHSSVRVGLLCVITEFHVKDGD